MLKVFASRNPVFRFSTKAFDLAVIGGGPGGTVFLKHRVCSSHQSSTVRSEHSMYRKERQSWRNMFECWMYSI